ncbi:MAG TPA: glycosyltransferase family 4 protein, partial [Vicinamibacteria bacterium]|nr:glycosyltransferase family 4 protein [Vicinamibacteria bacterium]
MRVLHLTDRLTDRGGAHRHLLSVTRALAERGHDVHIAAGATDSLSEDVPATTSTLPGLDSRTARPVDLDGLLDRVNPDVIHVHTVVNPLALESAAGRGAVFTVQDHRAFCPSRGKWTAQGEMCRVALSPAACAACFEDRAYFEDVLALTQARLAAIRKARVVVLSEYMRAELATAGLDAGRIHVVPPFVEFEEDAAPIAPAGPPCVLFVGRLVESKGPLDAVAAWRQSGVDLPLVVAGTGPLREEVVAAGAEVLGWVPHPHLPRLLRRARALLMPSRWQEPFGIAGLEALSFGVPVVAWDSGGLREWHEGPL